MRKLRQRVFNRSRSSASPAEAPTTSRSVNPTEVWTTSLCTTSPTSALPGVRCSCRVRPSPTKTSDASGCARKNSRSSPLVLNTCLICATSANRNRSSGSVLQQRSLNSAAGGMRAVSSLK
jgi:hypothetical protein